MHIHIYYTATVLAYFLLVSHWLVHDESNLGRVVSVALASLQNLKPLFAGGGDEQASVDRVLYSVDIQDSAVRTKAEKTETKLGVLYTAHITIIDFRYDYISESRYIDSLCRDDTDV